MYLTIVSAATESAPGERRPTQQGSVPLAVDQPVLTYSSTNCTKLVSTCGGYADKTGEKGTETLEFGAVAGETWRGGRWAD